MTKYLYRFTYQQSQKQLSWSLVPRYTKKQFLKAYQLPCEGLTDSPG